MHRLEANIVNLERYARVVSETDKVLCVELILGDGQLREVRIPKDPCVLKYHDRRTREVGVYEWWSRKVGLS